MNHLARLQITVAVTLLFSSATLFASNFGGALASVDNGGDTAGCRPDTMSKPYRSLQQV